MATKKKAGSKIGRPTVWSEEKAARLCEIISTSNKSLRTAAKEIGVDVSTILKQLNENEPFSRQYARAKEEQADFLAEEIIEISDDSGKDLLRIDDFGNRIENKEFVNRSRLRVDARKWVAAKLKPKKYGDKIDVSTNANVNLNLSNVSDEDLDIFLKKAGFAE